MYQSHRTCGMVVQTGCAEVLGQLNFHFSKGMRCFFEVTSWPSMIFVPVGNIDILWDVWELQI